MAKVVIFGAGQTAHVAYQYFTRDSEHEITAFAVNSDMRQFDELFGLPVVDVEDCPKLYPPDDYRMFVSMNYANLNRLRGEKFAEAKALGYSCVSYVSPRAVVHDNVEIGENCFILENQVIQPFVVIGNNVTIWASNMIGHHCVVEDHCWITSGVVLSGNVSIGSESFLGVNTSIGQNVRVGLRNFVGASSLITKDTKDGTVYVNQDTAPFALDVERFLRITKFC